jgi:hypothetical protein
MSRQELADAVARFLFEKYRMQVSIDAEYIGKYERGKHRWPTERYREAFRAVLHAETDAEIGLYIVRGEGSSAISDAAERPATRAIAAEPDDLLWLSSDTADLISRFTRRDLGMDRRDAARTLAGLAFGGALLEPLERWLLSADRPRRSERSSGFGVHEVEQIEAAARLFRTWDDGLGGGLRRKAVIGQLSEVADMLDGASPGPLTRRLYGAMSQLAGTAATMSWDSGQQRLAQQYYGLALRAAHEAGDREFGANVLAGMARQLLYLDRTNDALELVRLAQSWSHGHLSSKVASMLHTREAWAYARQGRVAAFRRATARAEETLDSSNADEQHPYWIEYFDQAELAGVTGGRLLELSHDRPALASETAEHIDSAIRLRRGRRLRSVSLDRIGVAEARLIGGEVDEACRLGHAAADVSEQTPSDRVKVKLREFYRCTRAYSEVPVVAELQQRIVGILRSPAVV